MILPMAPQSLTCQIKSGPHIRLILNIIMSHKESLESPLVPDNLVLNEIIGTAWYSIDSIVATHDAGSSALSHTSLKCWEISLYTMEQFAHVHQSYYYYTIIDLAIIPQLNLDQVLLH